MLLCRKEFDRRAGRGRNHVVSNYFDDAIAHEDKLIGTSYTIDDLYYGKRYDGTDVIIRKMRQAIKDLVANSNLPEQTKRLPF